jgi:hypothetical protein
MPDALKPSIPDGRGGAPCLMPCSPPFLRKRRCSMPDALKPSLPSEEEVLHA